MLKLLHLLKPYWIPLSALMVVIFGQVMGDLYLPTLMSDIVNKGITNSDVNYIINHGIRMLLVALGSSLAAVIASYLSSHIAIGFSEDLRELIFRRVSDFSLFEFDRIGTPSLVTRSTNDIMQIQNVLIMIQRMMLTAPFTAVGGMILALQKDSGMAWIILIAIPMLGIFIGSVAAKGFPLFQSIQKKIDGLNGLLRENLIGLRVIRAFNKSEYETKRFHEKNQDLMDTAVKVNRIFAVMFPFLMLIMNATMVAILWFGSHRVDRGLSNIGDMMAFMQYGMLILFSFLMASIMFIMIPRAQASAERINEVLALKPAIKDPENPQNPDGSLKGQVEFRKVRFSYPGAEAPALEDISFVSGPGETTAIIGSTGCGKSTLLSLIPRFYDIDSGSILVDGLDIREMSQKNLHQRIGLVPQQAVLFSGTVAENIRYGKEDATDLEIRKAAKTAQALDFIESMDQKFDSPLAQGGTNLSGGQKQRMAITRALVRKPEIYLFDDSFSALDFKTDSNLRRALKKETGNSTVIIVGQRVASIMEADRIIVLDEGKIVGMGTHQELFDSCGVYQEIVTSQMSEEELA